MKQKVKRRALNIRFVVAFFTVLTLIIASIVMPLMGTNVDARALIRPSRHGGNDLNAMQAKQLSNRVSEEIMEDGMVLLNNEIVSANGRTTNALPMPGGSRLTVLGKNSVEMVYGVGGSSGLRGGILKTNHLHQALEREGFTVNPVMRDFYLNGALSTAGRENVPIFGGGVWDGLSTGQTPWRFYRQQEIQSWSRYSDAAVVVISRQGGEGWDLPRRSTGGGNDRRAIRNVEWNGAMGTQNPGNLAGDRASFQGGREDLRPTTAAVAPDPVTGIGVQAASGYWPNSHPYVGMPASEGGVPFDSAAAATVSTSIMQAHPSVAALGANYAWAQERILADYERTDRRHDHYLQLDIHEEELLRRVKDSQIFDRVIVLINSGNMMELGFIEQFEVDATIWVGHPGSSDGRPGGGASNSAMHHEIEAQAQIGRLQPIGRFFNGDVNPSGRLVNVAIRDFRTDPTWNNFARVPDGWSDADLSRFNEYRDADGAGVGNGNHHRYVEYREGIFFDYYYFETRAFEEIVDAGGNNNWFDEYVVFPFGHGLSFTTFNWSIESSTIALTEARKDDDIVINVRVTNTGNRAGRDVVQVYHSPPYMFGGIEKAHVVLGCFAKTRLLQPGESQVVTVSFPIKQMSSWDQFGMASTDGVWPSAPTAANAGRYVLEPGYYDFFVSRSSNCWMQRGVTAMRRPVPHALTLSTNLNSLIEYRYSLTGEEYRNLFREETAFMHGELHIANPNEDLRPTLPLSVDTRGQTGQDVGQHQAGVGFYAFGASRQITIFDNAARNAQSIIMTRADFAGTFPTRPTDADRRLTSDGVAWMNARTTIGLATGGNMSSPEAIAAIDVPGAPWYRSTASLALGRREGGGTGTGVDIYYPTFASVGTPHGAAIGRPGQWITINDLHGLPFDHILWTHFLNQWTIDEMRDFIGNGGFSTGRGWDGVHTDATRRNGLGAANPMLTSGIVNTTSRFGILNNFAPDGPYGFTGQQGNNTHGSTAGNVIGRNFCSFPSPTIVAQTWDVELSERYGVAKGDEGYAAGFSGLYAPGMNTHRSPFGGRNSEYFAGDHVLAGRIVAAYVRGLQSRGVLPYMKHFFMNDQEINRDSGRGLITWGDEQTIRWYGEAWRIVVQEGGCMASMTSFARIGRVFAGHSYEALNNLLRYEWGFNGALVTDWWQNGAGYMSRDLNIRAGNDLPLQGSVTGGGANAGNNNSGARMPSLNDSPIHVYWMRRTTHNVAYAAVNSNTQIHFASDLSQRLVVGQPVAIDIRPRLSIMAFQENNEVDWGLAGPKNFIHHTANGQPNAGGSNAPNQMQGTFTVDNAAGNAMAIAAINTMLPEGLTFTAATGLITGTPTVAGTTSFNVSTRNFWTRSRNQANGLDTQHGHTRRFIERLSTNTFTLEIVAAANAGLVVPANPTVSANGVFSWDAVPGATAYEVRMVAVTTNAQGEQVITANANSVPFQVAAGTEINLSRYLLRGNYNVQVRAIAGAENDAGHVINHHRWMNPAYVSQWSDFTPITIGAVVQRPATQANVFTLGTEQALSWQAVPGATSYEISSFTASGIVQVNASTILVSDLYSVLGGGLHEIRVRAVFGEGTNAVRSAWNWSTIVTVTAPEEIHVCPPPNWADCPNCAAHTCPDCEYCETGGGCGAFAGTDAMAAFIVIAIALGFVIVFRLAKSKEAQ